MSTNPTAGAELLADGAVFVVRLYGELDISTVGLVSPIIDSVLAEHPDQLVADLKDVNFIDSSGIALLLSAAQQVPQLELRNPSSAVRRVIEATGLTEILVIG